MTDRLVNVERANRYLVAAWKAGILTEPRIDPVALETAALRGRNRTAFGPDNSWREPFERLVTALREEADLNPLGKTMAHSQIVHLLRGRIQVSRLAATARRDSRDAPPAPIIIVGQMRSGTTRMQRLLACDRRLAHTQAYETLSPVPAPGRKLRARAVLNTVKCLNPHTLRIHPSRATAPDEEFGWLAYGFGPAQFEAQWRVPSFSRWWEGADRRHLYRDFDQIMMLNRLARGERRNKPHILKIPQFCEDLPMILDRWPHARLIVLSRNIHQVVASSASLVWNHMRIQSGSVSKEWVGQEWLRKTRLRKERLAAALASRPDARSIQVEYDAMSDDWLSTMRRIYDFLETDLPPDLIRRMDRWLNSARDHLGHRYTLEEFGVRPDAINKGEMALAG